MRKFCKGVMVFSMLGVMLSCGHGSLAGDVRMTDGSGDSGPFAGGGGTANDPYRVSTAEQLDRIRDHLDAHFVQTADIDLSGYGGDRGWMPIKGPRLGSRRRGEPDGFSGVFDGNGHKILNLTMENYSPWNRRDGLFGVVEEDGVVKNVVLEDIDMRTYWYAGGLAGINTGLIHNCRVTGTIPARGRYVGLIAAVNGGRITASAGRGALSGESEVGGLVGRQRESGVISDSFFQGTVSGRSGYMGGIAGVNDMGRIERTYFAGQVSGAMHVGGIVGWNFEPGVIESSYYDASISGETDRDEGIPKDTARMKQQTTFDSWDFDGVWTIREDEDYPILKGME